MCIIDMLDVLQKRRLFMLFSIYYMCSWDCVNFCPLENYYQRHMCEMILFAS